MTGQPSWRTILHRADQFDIDKSEEWASAFHFRVELGDGEAQRSSELKRASGEAGVNVNAEFDLKVEDEDEQEEHEGLYLRIELWNSADDDDEVGFTQVKAHHTSMPKWLELHNDDGEFVCRIQVSMELQSTPVSQAAFSFEQEGVDETTTRVSESGDPALALLPSPSEVLGPIDTDATAQAPNMSDSLRSTDDSNGSHAIPTSPATDKEDDESEEEKEKPVEVLEEKAEDEDESTIVPHATSSTSLSALMADDGATPAEAVASSLVPARLPTTDRFSSEEWFTSMELNPEWALRAELPGVYSFGPTEFVFAPSRALLAALLSDAELESVVKTGITIRCPLSQTAAAQRGVLVKFLPGNFEEDGINFAAQFNVCHPAAGTFRVALPGARTYDPSADSADINKQAEAVDHKYALLMAALCSTQLALLVNGGTTEDAHRIHATTRPLLALLRGGDNPALMSEWMSEQVIYAVEGRKQAPSFGRYLEAKVRANGLDLRGPGYKHSRTYLVSLRDGAPYAPLSFVKGLVEDQTTRKQMSTDMSRKDFREVLSLASSGVECDSFLSTTVLYLLRLLLFLVLVPSALSFVQDVNRLPFADGEQLAVGTVVASCHGLNDLVAVGLCRPHQLTLASSGVLELRDVGRGAEAELVWSSLGTQKKKKNKQSQTYVAKRSGEKIAVFETKKKQNLVWEGTLEEHPALAAVL